MSKLFGKLTLGLFLLLSCLFLIEMVLYVTSIKGKRKESITYDDQFLHPHYFFFFASQKETLSQMEKAKDGTPWVDIRGFGGGYGPELKGSRELAFIIGGSTAFGDGATHPNQTLAPQLNRIQRKYYFVNAGVPSWNSYQELLRVMKQLIAYKPKLIISLTGYNDIANAFERRIINIPTDTPETYVTLQNWVADIRTREYRNWTAKNYLLKHTPYGILFLYNLRHKFGLTENFAENRTSLYLHNRTDDEIPSIEEHREEIVSKFLENLNYMNELSKLNNIKYLAILQPNLNIRDAKSPDYMPEYKKTVDDILKKKEKYILDLTIPFKNEEPEEVKKLFVDLVHLNDEGYEKLASELWNLIKPF
jgi:lysophospholipase L1-like esterase